MVFAETFQLVSTTFGCESNTVANMASMAEVFNGGNSVITGLINSSLKKSTKICQLILY